MPELSDRKIPFMITTVYFLMTTWFLFQKSEIDPIMWQGMAVISVAVLLLTAISFFWKMSAHMTGLGGLLSVVFVLGSEFPTFKVLYPLLVALVLCGLVASSRLLLQAHKPVEVYAGWLMGFMICWIGFSLIWS